MNNSEHPGLQLHSKYKPQQEADRYIDALNLPINIEYFILIEPGFGYLISTLQKKYPQSKIITLHADNCFHAAAGEHIDIPTWFPDSGMSVQEFLEEAVGETASVRLIEWRPSLRIYGTLYGNLVQESVEYIKRASASNRTVAAFGRRWVHNFFRNLTFMHTGILYKAFDMPIVITGSGPSLESTIPKIRTARESIFILAASSSLPALIVGGIMPDMVLSTDGGGWALMHLHSCFRSNGMYTSAASKDFKLAFALTAAIPSQCFSIPLLPLNDGTTWQNLVLHSLGIPSITVPQRGTVTASAIDLAMTLSQGSIFLAGMDLSVRDIQSHARPYGFDFLFYGSASRFKPVYSQYFVRSGEIKAGGSHDVYAAWFKTKLASWPNRIYSLGGNHSVLINALPELAFHTGAGSKKDIFKKITINTIPIKRCKYAIDTLTVALDNPQYKDILIKELAPLLFPSQPDVGTDDIAKVLLDLANCYGGESG
jgi:hypothetical protein